MLCFSWLLACSLPPYRVVLLTARVAQMEMRKDLAENFLPM